MKLAGALMCALLLLCLYSGALAVEAGVIAVPSIPAANMDMPKPLITKPNMNMPEPKPSSGPDNSSAQALNQTAAAEEEEKKAAEDRAAVLSGKWSVQFDGLRDRTVDLTLWSSGTNKVMGFGTLNLDGTGISMSASGSLNEDELKLAVKSAQVEYGSPKYQQYDLDMSLVDGALSGTYALRSGSEPPVTGNATAVKH
ncbi:MAG: hypothetical protein HPY61_07790 [Methanotrichaceae archaeon]|nr:hypothetical protein [Methanotrichaceae archaeon]